MDHIDRILERIPHIKRDILIPLLQEVQDEDGFISEEALVKIGHQLGLPASKIYGLATFYNQFRFVPRGRYHIELCNGTTCHMEGSGEIIRELEKILGISDGQVTKDGNFSLEVQSCIGACGDAPVIAINGRYYKAIGVKDLRDIIKNLTEGLEL